MLEQTEVASGLNVTKLNMDEEMPNVRNYTNHLHFLVTPHSNYSFFYYRVLVGREFTRFSRV